MQLPLLPRARTDRRDLPVLPQPSSGTDRSQLAGGAGTHTWRSSHVPPGCRPTKGTAPAPTGASATIRTTTAANGTQTRLRADGPAIGENIIAYPLPRGPCRGIDSWCSLNIAIFGAVYRKPP